MERGRVCLWLLDTNSKLLLDPDLTLLPFFLCLLPFVLTVTWPAPLRLRSCLLGLADVSQVKLIVQIQAACNPHPRPQCVHVWVKQIVWWNMGWLLCSVIAMNNNQQSNESSWRFNKHSSYTQEHTASFSLSPDTLISEWWPVAQTSLVVHVCTSCANWWPHISDTHTHTHSYTLTGGKGFPRLRSQLDLPQDKKNYFKVEGKCGNILKPFESLWCPISWWITGIKKLKHVLLSCSPGCMSMRPTALIQQLYTSHVWRTEVRKSTMLMVFVKRGQFGGDYLSSNEGAEFRERECDRGW